MADELRLIYEAFNEILKLKQLSKFSNKYNKVLIRFCEILIKRFENHNDHFERLIKSNCCALQAAIAFSTNPNNNLFDVTSVYGTPETLNTFLNDIHIHLKTLYQIQTESFEGYSAIRLQEIIHLNCKIFLDLFNSTDIKTDIELFNKIIKHLCLIFNEIITARIKYEYHKCYDVLQQHNSNTFKLLLELKIEALQKYTDTKNEPQIIQQIIELHNDLLNKITGYIHATATDIADSE